MFCRGVSNGGKTTLSRSLYKYLCDNKRTEVKKGFILQNVHLINQDTYIRKINDPNHHKIKEMNNFINYEIIESIDMDLMFRDVFQILGSNFALHRTKSSGIFFKNENVFHENYAAKLHYSLTQSIEGYNGDEGRVRPTVMLNILIIEGFLIYNHPVLMDLFNIKFHIHVPYEVSKERRRNRVYAVPDIPMYFELFVWTYYEKHMKEYANREEIISLSEANHPEKCFDYVKQRIWSELWDLQSQQLSVNIIKDKSQIFILW